VDDNVQTRRNDHANGIDNVRGALFTNFHLSDEEKTFIKKLQAAEMDRCYRCNGTGHFAENCRRNQTEVRAPLPAPVATPNASVPTSRRRTRDEPQRTATRNVRPRPTREYQYRYPSEDDFDGASTYWCEDYCDELYDSYDDYY
jgi:hypothetical protein